MQNRSIVVVCIVSIAFVYPSHAKYPKYGSYEHHRIFSTCSTGNTGWKNTFIRSALQSWLRSVVPLRHLKGDVNHADKTLFQTTVGQFYVNETNYQLVAVENNDMVWFQFGGEDEADGWLVGRMSVSNHVATGEDLGFIFPDFSTALVGKFERDKLISGHARKVKAYRCQNGIMELMYDILFQPDSVYKFEEANGTFITSEPLLMDPYDKRNVYVMPSRIPNTGQGLFAKRTIPARTLVVSYAGIKVVDEELLFHDKMTSAEEEDAHKNLMSYSDDFSLDIPPHLSSLHQYRATLAHKARKIQSSKAKNEEDPPFP
eukprot:snap_masked-scaffold17_size721972-processed-gene-6.6 protein:Tk09987 transcript:snap_masked-scaffold17_size721972-processed-gene-6.6-mRNA-1 annotation:"setd7_halro ame: full"